MSDTPKIYDVSTDERRAVTQADIDGHVALAQAHGAFVTALDEEIAAFHRRVNALREAMTQQVRHAMGKMPKATAPQEKMP